MNNCVKCQLPDLVVKAGFLRGRQRYLCKACEYHFIEPKTGSNATRRRTQVTIHDVAKVVGVASSTVSRALNGHADISPATRQAIK
ncbi:MAG: LacI family DNA-binding transcriptional regulator, partial [Hymenobacter sp.]